MSYDAVIFDLFGTLVDYFPKDYYRRSYEKTAEALRAPVSGFKRVWASIRDDRDLGRFGNLHGDIVNVCKLMGIDPDPAHIQAAAQIRLDTYRRNLEPRSGALHVLTELRSTGHRTGLISVCACEIPMLWPDSALAPRMDTTVFSCEEGLTKPDPRIYLLACERLGVSPDKCLYIGDGSYDELNGAKRAGMHPVLIYVGYSDGPDHLAPEAEGWKGPVAKSLPEILEMVQTCHLSAREHKQ